MNSFNFGKIAAGVGLLSVAGLGSAQTTLFNATPGGTYFTNSSGAVLDTPTEGEVFGLGASNQALTGFGFDMLNGIGITTGSTTYTDIQVEATVFSGYQTSYSGSGNEFTTAVYSQTFDLGGATLNNGYYYALTGSATAPEFTFSTPVNVTGSTVGIQFTILANTGTGLGSAAGELQIGYLASNSAPTVGVNAFAYPNLVWGGVTANSSTSLNQGSNYIYTGSNDSNLNLAVELYGKSQAVPEPISMSLLGLGAIGLIARRRK